MKNYKLRTARIGDLPEIVNIYNWAVRNTTATFDLKEKRKEELRQWYYTHNEYFPLIVAETSASIIGWGALSQFDKKPAYNCTAEVSLYIHPNHQGKGVGSAILDTLLKSAKGKLHNIVSRITTDNTTSMKMHKKHGFFLAGTMKEVGRKFDRYLDVSIYQKIID
ncbi:MAG: N-acetyltransferase family protein [Spirochaetia bacterium]